MRVIKRGYLFSTLLIIALYLLPVTGSASAIDTYLFRVLLDDKPVGSHRMDIRFNGDVTQVDIQASLDVKLLFLSVYRYQHVNTETWYQGCLQSIESTTDDNGELYQLKARRNAENLIVENGQEFQMLQGCVRSFAYWDPGLLQDDRLLNAQTGEYQPVEIKELGEESIIVSSRPTLARRLQLVTDEDVIDLWYQQDNRWVALESVTRGGRTLRYELMQEAEDV